MYAGILSIPRRWRDFWDKERVMCYVKMSVGSGMKIGFRVWCYVLRVTRRWVWDV